MIVGEREFSVLPEMFREGGGGGMEGGALRTEDAVWMKSSAFSEECENT